MVRECIWMFTLDESICVRRLAVQRNVSAHLGITVTTPATLAFMVALAEGADAD